MMFKLEFNVGDLLAEPMFGG